MPGDQGKKAIDDWDSLPLDPADDDWDAPKPPAAPPRPGSPDAARNAADSWDEPEGPSPEEGAFGQGSFSESAPADSWLADAKPGGPEGPGRLDSPGAGLDFGGRASLGLEGEGLGADSDGFGEDGAGADGEDGEGEGADGEGLGDGQEPPPRFEEPKSASDTRDRAPYERQRPPIQGVDDQSRADFLKSLMDGDGDAVPQKVELDLDGIFDQARKEAEKLSPDATSLPVEAPEPESETAPPPPEEHIDLAPLSAGGVKKVARYKMLIVLSTLGVVVLCTLFALYRIFFRTVPPPPQTRPFVVEPDPLTSSRVPIPGEMPLGRFYLTLGDPQNAVVVEMEITLHYHDSFDAPIILREMTLIRDIIYRLVAPLGPELLTDTGVRRGLQADLLQTLNNIEALRSDAADPRLTYVQISALTKR